MPTKFDYTQVLQNAALRASGSSVGAVEGEGLIAPSSVEYFRDYINPGHQNNADWLQYVLKVDINTQHGSLGSSFKWEMQPRGSTVWTALSTYQLGSSWPDRNMVSGTFSSSALALPIIVRMVTRSASTIGYSFRNFQGDGYCAVRVVGDITT